MKRPNRVPKSLNYMASQFVHRMMQLLDIEDMDSLLSESYVRRFTVLNAAEVSGMTYLQRLKLLQFKDRFPEHTKLIRNNTKQLCNLFELPANAAKLVEFLFVMNGFLTLHDFLFDIDCRASCYDFEPLICELCDIERDEAHEALLILQKFGIVEKAVLSSATDLMIPDVFTLVMLHQPLKERHQLIENAIIESPIAVYDIESFTNVNWQLSESFLTKATLSGHEGINLLLYGEPGTGKTEFARALAFAAGRRLLEVPAINIRNGSVVADDPERSANRQRVQYLQFLQNFMDESDDTILLVDECESLFYQADGDYTKDLLLRLLEHNKVPCIWITNHEYLLEDSMIRRFNLVQQMSPPDKNTLLELTQKAFKGLAVSEKFRQQLINTKHLTPAMLSNAAYVAKMIEVKKTGAESVIQEVIENTLKASNLLDSKPMYQFETQFEPELLNLKQSPEVVAQITSAIERKMPVRVLLVGPAGTGKTAFAHYLSQQYQRELVRITCSDVLSKYVGESEQKIAQIFREAKANRQMLLLDEVDSLLSSRAQSTMLHERQMVNELLVQIECFDQPLFAATNFETSLDTAVLRRFDFKLECGYLEFVQARALLRQVLGITSLNKEDEKQLQTLKYLTPGDFAIAARRKKYSVTNLSTQSAIAILAEENARKQPKRTIGFN